MCSENRTCELSRIQEMQENLQIAGDGNCKWGESNLHCLELNKCKQCPHIPGKHCTVGYSDLARSVCTADIKQSLWGCLFLH